MLRFFEELISRAAFAGIDTWLRLAGKRVAKADATWLACPMGPGGIIGAEFYSDLATREDLTIELDDQAGLIRNLSELKSEAFDPEDVAPEIRRFYEHTAAFQMDVWSEASLLTRVFLWALIRFVSRRMDQLNFPVSSLETARGMSSDVLPMIDREGRRVYTGWMRRLIASGRIVYTGLYSVGRPELHPHPCMKVSFPVPRGSATVFLYPRAGKDGSLRLVSSGSRFGDPGFYRMLEVGPDHWRVRYLRSLRETFHIYVDTVGTVRADHTIQFMGLSVLRLHFRMEPLKKTVHPIK